MRTPYTQSGFSLVELLVSLTIFSVVITMAVGTMLILIDANNKSQNMNNLMTNLTFAMGSMARELRTGSHYYCNSSTNPPSGGATRDCINGGTLMSVIETDSSLTKASCDKGSVCAEKRITYYLDTTGYYGNGYGVLMRKIGENGTARPLTGPEINITKLTFTVTGSDADDSEVPIVSISIEGEAGEVENFDTSFRLQTTVTQRELDL